MQDVVILGCADLLTDRPFTDPDHVSADSAVLRTMAEQAWRVADEIGSPTELPRQPTSYFPDEDRWQKRTMILDRAAMQTVTSLTAVGFFGNKRAGLDAEIEARIFEAGRSLCAALKDHPSIVCYATNLLADSHNYANLVLMQSPQTIEEWRGNAFHQQVTETISPQYYNNVRIYSGTIHIHHNPRRFDLDLQRVKYFDYSLTQPWYGVRELAQIAM